MKYSKCPHCGSEEGFVGEDVPMIGYQKVLFTVPGENEIRTFGKRYYEIIDGFMEIDYIRMREFLYEVPLQCASCNEYVCTYGEMFEEKKQ